MKKLILGIDRFLSVVGIALTAILAAGVIISVILRYVFSIAFVQSEELLTMVFVATTFFGPLLGFVSLSILQFPILSQLCLQNLVRFFLLL